VLQLGGQIRVVIAAELAADGYSVVTPDVVPDHRGVLDPEVIKPNIADAG